MTRPGDVRLACELGIDALGFVFAEQSRRYVSADTAAELRRAVGPFVHVVALFMNNKPREVEHVLRVLKPHMLQFHGDESESECNRYGVPYMKSLPMAEGVEAVERLAAQFPSAQSFLLDSNAKGQAGGTGKSFDWSKLPRLHRPFLLAGGLTAENVREAIRVANPMGVDASSGIELSPGIKDGAKMHKFIFEVSQAHAQD